MCFTNQRNTAFPLFWRMGPKSSAQIICMPISHSFRLHLHSDWMFSLCLKTIRSRRVYIDSGKWKGSLVNIVICWGGSGQVTSREAGGKGEEQRWGDGWISEREYIFQLILSTLISSLFKFHQSLSPSNFPPLISGHLCGLFMYFKVHLMIQPALTKGGGRERKN